MTSKKFQKETRPLSLLMRISARERKAIEMGALENNLSLSEFMRSASKLKQLIAKYENQTKSNETKS
jgi:hypothetical protein